MAGYFDKENIDRLYTGQAEMHRQFQDLRERSVFHAQLIQDYVTIDEFGREMLKEFERHGL